MKRVIGSIWIVVFLLIITMPFVAAEGGVSSLLDNIFRPFEGSDWGDIYLKNYLFIDGILYFMLFFAISKFSFSFVFKKAGAPKTSNLLSIAVTLMLTFAMMYFESKSPLNFKIGDLWFVAMYVFLILMWYFIYIITKILIDTSPAGGKSKNWQLAVGIAMFISYYIIQGITAVMGVAAKGGSNIA